MIEIITTPPKAQLVVTRKIFTNQSTVGQLLFKGFEFCFTLEDTVRKQKLMHQTAIPAGRYKLYFDVSSRFGYSPLLVDVPYFEGIRMHWGNTDVDTSGCLLLGRTHTVDFVGESKLAYMALMDQLIPMKVKEDIWIEIYGGLTKEQMFPNETT